MDLWLLSVADLGIDGRGVPPEVWALPHIGSLGLCPQRGCRGQSPRCGVWGQSPPEAEA